MPKAKYPLDALQRLRGEKVDAAARALGAATRVRQAATDAILAAEAERDEHRRSVARIEDAERQALARGELCAGDMTRAAAWSAHAEVAARGLEGKVDRARAEEARACDAEHSARAVTASRAAEGRAVAGHRERWQDR